MRLAWIDDHTPLPPPDRALREPNGLLAAGGSLTTERLREAYRHGIFPWYSAGQPVLWWAPDPRCVLFPQEVHVSRSLRKTLNKRKFRFTWDEAFEDVVNACAAPRDSSDGTWITPAMHKAYVRLYAARLAHSIEVWEGDQLVGGLYGVSLGRVFYGESMFSRRTDASKAALVKLSSWLCDWGYALLDCQVSSPHLHSLGAVDLPRTEFLRLLDRWCEVPPKGQAWRNDTYDTGAPSRHHG